MISRLLAPLEEHVEGGLEDIAADASMPKPWRIKIDLIHTLHDPTTGIYAGGRILEAVYEPVFTEGFVTGARVETVTPAKHVRVSLKDEIEFLGSEETLEEVARIFERLRN